ncbi:MAG: LysM peptidoglycan-binding domain-containing protein [Roseburia sp.]|nr:LysM peptidoglycan-binding domain-containing protein [Roseburia sp.]
MQYQENMMPRQCRGIIHIIQKGDTLYLLSKKYHVSVTKIMYANPYVDIYNLTIGDELCIPVSLRKPMSS